MTAAAAYIILALIGALLGLALWAPMASAIYGAARRARNRRVMRRIGAIYGGRWNGGAK